MEDVRQRSSHGRARSAHSGARGPRRGRGRRRRSGIGWSLAVAAIAVLTVALLAALDLRQAYADLTTAEQAAGRARSALLAGDIPAAAEAFATAERAFGDAGAELRSGTVRSVGLLPIAGRNLDVVGDLSDAGRLAATAGSQVTTAILELPGGTAALAPREGRLPVEHIAALAPALEEAAALVQEADAIVAATPSRLVVGPVARAKDDFTEQLATIREPVRAGGALAGILPAYLGAEGPRRYFFGAQNPAEARGTGGLIGAWTVLTVDQGQLRFGEFETIATLSLEGPEAFAVPPPNDDYGARYGRFAAAGHGSNINMTPDFPTAAEAILNLYERRRGDRLDGAIVADPAALEALLRLTGPVEVPDVRTIDARNVMAFLTNEQWDEFPGDGTRKPVLGEAAKTTLQRFLAGAGGDSVRGLQVLGEVVGDRHLLLHATDPAVQDALTAAGVGGAFAVDDADVAVSVIVNNAAANKVDYYMEQRQRHEVWLDGSGDAYVRTTVQLSNRAPETGAAGTVLGPQVDGLGVGDHLLYTSAYCGPGCELESLLQDGEPQTVGSAEELGLQVFPATIRVDAGETTELVYEWRQRAAWDGSRARLVVPGQALLRPTTTEVVVHPPLDHVLVSESGGGETTPSGAWTWSGAQPHLEVDLRAGATSTLTGMLR